MRSVVACGLVAVASCSFASMRVPSEVPPDRYFSCHGALPILDGIGTLVGVGSVAYGVALATGPTAGGGQGGAVFMGYGSVSALVFGASTIYGVVKNARCRRMRDVTPEQLAERYTGEAETLARAGDCYGAVVHVRTVGMIQPGGAELLARAMARPTFVACNAKLASDAQRASAAAAAQQQAAAAAYAAEEDRKQRQKDAQPLVKQARDAAHVGDCAAVANLGAKILALDPDIHAVWFMHDTEIAACLDAEAAPTSGAP